MTEMTSEVLMAACKNHGGYAAPHLNDQLFLQCRGFLRISNLKDYVNLKVLWLEQNAISELSGLDGLQQLVSLFVQNNTISSLCTLAVLSNLRVLNLSHNYLTSLSGLAVACPQLETFQVSHNHIGSLDACTELWGLKETLTSVDFSFNKIEVGEEDLGPMDFFAQLPKVSVIYFHGNPGTRGLKGYRRNMILRLPQLTYLDERPVFAEERRVVEAWGAGGDAAEAMEREAIRREKKDHLESCVKVLVDRMDENREVRDRLTKQWEEKRAVEMERFQALRCKWRAEQSEMAAAEERNRTDICAAETDERCVIEAEFYASKKTLDVTEAAYRNAYRHQKEVEAVQEAVLKEIEAEEEKDRHSADEAGDESAVRGWMMSDEDILQEMEEEIMRALEPLVADPLTSRTALKMERAMGAVASRLSVGAARAGESRPDVWEKFAQWESRVKH
ncbi:Leucine-rich repeat-containing protein ODA7 [Trypanosoma grayi]|uniref:Leucine-rich repeat-containing protein ODA7 n=1 Tax=Trypanosoma grayi TaxID=71804 RepID=UPI0004F43785|nr:Leucine-rich repeat-containing protein ODA7 [Trypanosoma grayi]KEG11663.1 Leucine-rich repeat-containing protein ODA7 [Trypanosoma grayi]